MTILNDISSLSQDGIEDIEKLTLRWLTQATLDFGFEAHEIFYYSPDKVKDIAEDITRDIVDRLAGYNISCRIFGTVDYKKARYIILPNQIVRQALFVDSKAEKSNANATLQITQTSLEIRQKRSGKEIREQGGLPAIYTHEGKQFLSSTLFLHYHYDDDGDKRHLLNDIIVCCVPNGMLQDRYNPTSEEGFWKAGRNAPSRGEDFRVRVSFNKLRERASWRVQKIRFDSENKTLSFTWQD
ncbi:MAG: BglI family type II restriction endonuclease [Zoogloeaceae bacterium]|jgi:hypothetical protein|nr:BglI family type II restriction endonuclease [Zoogloeaceae bacterium]